MKSSDVPRLVARRVCPVIASLDTATPANPARREDPHPVSIATVWLSLTCRARGNSKHDVAWRCWRIRRDQRSVRAGSQDHTEAMTGRGKERGRCWYGPKHDFVAVRTGHCRLK